jgi:predicted RNase H-like HicB family nuclease
MELKEEESLDYLAVVYRQDAKTSWWTATVEKSPALVTQGKTLKEAYERVRKALSLVRDDSQTVLLKGSAKWDHREDIPSDQRQMIADETNLRIHVLEMETALEHATRVAIVQLREKNYSFRKIGQLLGITYQRVEQLSKESAHLESSG